MKNLQFNLEFRGGGYVGLKFGGMEASYKRQNDFRVRLGVLL